ncbi:MAG: rluC, partial [Phenylobacterium sp.]|nr:rluC [Phenylobacterium sp.]
MREVRTITVGEGEEAVRLDRWFRRRWPHLSQGQLAKLIRSGQVRVNGGRAKPETRVDPGDQIRVPPLPDAPVRGEREKIDSRDAAFAKSLVIYEDEEVLAINKPSGLAVQGG